MDVFSHRNGLDILESPRFRPAYDEFVSVLKGLPPFRAARAKRLARYVIAPTAMNSWLDDELCVKRDWDWHPLIMPSDPGEPRGSQLRSDYRKSRIEVEVQFGNVARYAYDVYKMAISLAMGQADVGIQVVCSKRFASITGDNLAYFERAMRELERSRLTLIVPLIVIGIEPEQWIVDAYPAEQQAPVITASVINAARKSRGAPPVDAPDPEAPSLSLRDLRRIAALVAR